MNLQPIYPKTHPFTAKCACCEGTVQSDTGFADLEGRPFRDYYCIDCASYLMVASLAYERGKSGLTFATADEYRSAVYGPAYTLGQEYREGRRVVEPHCEVGCGCPHCRLLRIVRERVR